MSKTQGSGAAGSTNNLRFIVLSVLLAVLWISWVVMYVRHIQKQDGNYWWQAGLAAYAVLGGAIGLTVANKWSGLKSGIGRSLIYLSLGLISWGVGQAGWTYYTFKGVENPTSLLVSTIYFISIPFWFLGILQLSHVTGAKFVWRKTNAKLMIAVISIILLAASYYFLVNVARGGLASYEGSSFTTIFYDLGYAFGDVLLLMTAISIYVLSWKLLGGRFKVPIILILSSFILLYVADFAFSFVDGRGEYYNGHWCDVVYLIVMALMSIAISMMYPYTAKSSRIVSGSDSDIPMAAAPTDEVKSAGKD